MKIRSIVKHSGKAVTAVGIVAGAWFVLNNLLLLGAVGTVSLVVFYLREIKSMSKAVGSTIAKVLTRKYPELAMKYKLEKLSEGKAQLEEKQKRLNGKIKALEEKINISRKDETTSGITPKLIELKDILIKNKERLDVLSKNVETKVENLQGQLKAKSLLGESLKEVKDIAEDVKDIISSENDVNMDDVDISMATVMGELEELIEQINKEVAK